MSDRVKMKYKWMVYWKTPNGGFSMDFGSKFIASLYGAKMLRKGFDVRMEKKYYEWED